MRSTATILALVIATSYGFTPPAVRHFQQHASALRSSTDDSERIEQMNKILMEESMNPDNMKESAERMKSMTPTDMDSMMKEMDSMSAVQQQQLKAMGMDPAMMKKSMEMMRDNPAMMANVGKMMEDMTPEQLVQQSLAAQEQMKNMPSELVDVAANAVRTVSRDESAGVTDAEIVSEDDNDDNDDKDDAEPVPGSSTDPTVVDKMFGVAELMSMPPNGGVTLQAFSALPPITLLSGTRDIDLSKKELSECWLDGSLGATRVDRAGFERVWKEVQEYFEDDIMEEARKMSMGRSKAATASPIAANPVVGASISPQQLQDQVKNMQDSDMTAMLEQMDQMTPEQEARMKAMGVDPAMMQKTANMMKSNPLLRKAATTMMKNMSPEQMMKASQQAQEKMGGMSKEDYDKAMEMMNKENK